MTQSGKRKADSGELGAAVWLAREACVVCGAVCVLVGIGAYDWRLAAIVGGLAACAAGAFGMWRGE